LEVVKVKALNSLFLKFLSRFAALTLPSGDRKLPRRTSVPFLPRHVFFLLDLLNFVVASLQGRNEGIHT